MVAMAEEAVRREISLDLSPLSLSSTNLHDRHASLTRTNKRHIPLAIPPPHFLSSSLAIRIRSATHELQALALR